MNTVNQLNTQKTLLLTEFYKIRKYKPLWIIFGILVVLLTGMFINQINLSEQRFNMMFGQSGFSNKWLYVYDGYISILSFLLPSLIGLIVASSIYMEIAANGYSLLNRSPYSLFNFDAIKILSLILISILFCLIAGLFIILFSELTFILKPEFQIDPEKRSHFYLIKFIPRYFPYLISLCAFYYLLSLLIKNFTVFMSLIIILPLLTMLIIPDVFNLMIYPLYENSIYYSNGNPIRMRLQSFPSIDFHKINVLYIIIFSLLIYFIREKSKK
ncbi:ABC transporter permease [Marivirga salinae]|uniref:ABC transporter permease n=1 Tax=Marivirga salinarum TaxID=3059078 RepID=A0AA49GB16_9BACT|nr:ABC transporter permease [Marivirga sp. BDSF4-3]WKK77157.2 ABC transporter permease [Marivirga sp. BDSF4-3]